LVMTAAGWEAHLPAGMRAEDLDLTAKGSLPSAWATVWASNSSTPNLFTESHGWTTAGELDDATRRVAGRLQGAGLGPGDRMLFSADSSLELVIAHVAALRSGIVVVPANAGYRAREVAHIVSDARPKAALVDGDDRASWVRAAASSEMLVVGPEVDLPDHAASTLDAAAPDDAALIGYTSGTTGSPKGAVLSHANLLAGSESVGLAWRWAAADRLVLALPLFHAHGLCVGLHGTLLAGASAVLLRRFEVDAVLDAAREHEVSMFFGVPTMYHRLARSPRVGELARLRLCVSGSAPLPAELHRSLAERGGQHVLERYGMTETLMLVSNPYDGKRRPGSVGFPLPGVELRFSDGGRGEIQVRGANVFSGYWDRPHATAESFVDGWFRTGDLGSMDPEGYVTILGRSKELIISGGINVYPREVEEVLLSHPEVAEVAVVGTPSDEWGEVVTAFVVSAGEQPTPGPLLAFAAERLAPFKRPRLLHFVDSLPRNALGTVLKHDLVR
ncbi:MAG: class I adenylate-forming enzyme family protein, partial [Solirubrobacteraceae bacterium]